MSIAKQRITSLVFIAFVGCLLITLGTVAEAAERWPSFKLLLPCFEVRLDGSEEIPPSLTTYFAVVNPTQQTQQVRFTVRSNWGLEILQSDGAIEARAVITVDLARWILAGRDPFHPDLQMTAEERAHVQAALCGEMSPTTGLYYSDLVDPAPPLRAVGSVLVEALGQPGKHALFGDIFVLEPARDYAQGEVLANLDQTVPMHDADDLCLVHAFRFMEDGGFNGHTDFMVWADEWGAAEVSPNYPGERIPVHLIAYNNDGQYIGSLDIEAIPMEMVSVDELDLPEPFGWIRIETPIPTYAGVRYSARDRYSVGMETHCLPPERLGLRLNKWTNGVDADREPGAPVAAGSGIVWTYVVTNVGGVPVFDLVLVDSDPLVNPVCPETELEPGESMTCTAEGVAIDCGNYSNLATVTGFGPDGEEVEASDNSFYHVVEGEAITLEKSTNGHDADLPPGPTMDQGIPVTWAFVITNTGEVPLFEIALADDKLGAVPCPETSLDVGASMTCSVNGVAGAGPHRNLGSVSARTRCGSETAASDPSHYTGRGVCEERASIELEKSTNGYDADTAPGPTIDHGAPVIWSYRVTNTGDVPLTQVFVTDDKLGAISCPKSTLGVGETMFCSATGVAGIGPYSNLGSVSAMTRCERRLLATDPSHYFGATECDEQPLLLLEKSTNGHDADTAPGPEIGFGEPVAWQYQVTNAGDVELSQVAVWDDQIGAIACPEDTLLPGETMVCTALGEAVEGQYANLGVATGEAPCSGTVEATDPSHYHGTTPEGDQGCTPGYWKNHVDSWAATGLSPSQSVVSLFGAASAYPELASATLLEALSFGGGPSLTDKAAILLRAAVAAALNASHPGVTYPVSFASVIGDTNAALASGDADAILALADSWDAWNNLGCPLS